MKYGLLSLMLALTVAGTAACSSQQTQPGAPAGRAAGPVQPARPEDLRLTTGQVIFVPAYSEIFYLDQDKTLNLAITLAIHNTDLASSIIIKSVRYYDTNGNLVEEFIKNPIKLGPMGTTGFVLNQNDDRGGVGANFIVEWGAEKKVYEPVVEAVMVSTSGAQGISLLSTGRVISQIGAGE
ncbi:MAG: hypothetical protein FOGNACKC_02954 [Anaerolineae bacterium]|nr:hypothetical protein [Anaerolineae bacterium]